MDTEPDEAAIEKWLVQKIQRRGIASLSNDEVSVAFHSRDFGKEWERMTGKALPETMKQEMAGRLQNRTQSRSSGAFGEPVIASSPSSAILASSDSVAVAPVPPLHAAIIAKDYDGIRGQLTAAADLRGLLETSYERRSALHVAAREGSVQALQLLLDFGASVDNKDGSGRTALMVCCEYGNCSAAVFLLNSGADPETLDLAGRNAFHLACCADSVEISLALLSRRPALLESADRVGRTGLFYAVLNANQSMSVEIVKSLIQRKAAVNRLDAVGRSPLHYAAEAGRPGVVGLLIGAGCEGGARDANGRAPADLIAGLPAAVRAEVDSKLRGFVQNSETVKPATVLPPVATQLALREKIVRLFQQTQDGGLYQFEHIKSPHLFSSSWAEGVNSVSDLFGTCFSGISADTAIKLFNLLFPPKSFPVCPTDEVSANTILLRKFNWEGLDPYAAATAPSGGTAETARRIQELKMEIEVRERLLAELRVQINELNSRLSSCVPAVDLRIAREDLSRLRSDLSRGESLIAEMQRANAFADSERREFMKKLDERDNERTKFLVKLGELEESLRVSSGGVAEAAVLRDRLKFAEERADQLARDKGRLMVELRGGSTAESRGGAADETAGTQSADVSEWKSKYENALRARFKAEFPLLNRFASSTNRFIIQLVGGSMDNQNEGIIYALVRLGGHRWRSRSVSQLIFFEEWETPEILEPGNLIEIEFWKENDGLPHILLCRFEEDLGKSTDSKWQNGFREQFMSKSSGFICYFQLGWMVADSCVSLMQDLGANGIIGADSVGIAEIQPFKIIGGQDSFFYAKINTPNYQYISAIVSMGEEWPNEHAKFNLFLIDSGIANPIKISIFKSDPSGDSVVGNLEISHKDLKSIHIKEEGVRKVIIPIENGGEAILALRWESWLGI